MAMKIPSTTRAALSTPLTPANEEYSQGPGFQCLIVAKTEGHGLRAVCSDPIFVRASVPTSQEYLAQSRNESILCQSPPGQCNLTCCGLLRSRQRMMSSPLRHLWALVFLCSGIHVPVSPLTTEAATCTWYQLFRY